MLVMMTGVEWGVWEGDGEAVTVGAGAEEPDICDWSLGSCK